MNKSLPILAVLLLTGSAILTTAACSSSSSGGGTTEDDGGTDAAKDAKVPVDTGTEDDAGPSVCPTTDPITAADIESVIDWKSPKPTQAVCNQTNMDALKAVFTAGGGSAKYSDVKDALGTTCADCAFTQFTAANWGPYVETDSGIINNSTAACFAELDGNACGKSTFEYNGCLNIACNTTDCGTDTAKVSACKTKAAKGACKDLTTALQTNCKNLQTDVNACANIFLAVLNTCAGGADGGIDAAAP